MTAQAWHVLDEQLAAYTAGGLDALQSASVEQHLVRCAVCREAIRPHTDVGELEALWDEIDESLHRPPMPFVLRMAQRMGLSEPTAIILAATAALRTAWLIGASVALSFALAASHLPTDNTLWPFLLLAPLVPVLGVATAYGPSWDPLEGLVVTAPYGRTRLVLVRTLAVLVTCVPVAVVLGLMLPGPGWVAVAWLGPALAMIPVLLALAGFIGPRLASAVLALAWGGLVGGAVRPYPPTWPVEPDRQLVFLALAAVAVVVLVARSRADHRMGVTL